MIQAGGRWPVAGGRWAAALRAPLRSQVTRIHVLMMAQLSLGHYDLVRDAAGGQAARTTSRGMLPGAGGWAVAVAVAVEDLGFVKL